MRSAKIFLAGMYVHIVTSIAVPVSIFVTGSNGWNKLGVGLFLGYLLLVGAVHLLGWISAGLAVCAYRNGEAEKVIKGWKLLKLWSIPFYILNFIYSFLVWFVLIGASRGILLLLVPIPVYITCSMVVQSGIYGICVIRCLRRSGENSGTPGSREKPLWIHYILQLVSITDIISTVVILKRYLRKY